MDKIGIPRGLFYYYCGNIWKYFFNYLNIPCVVSPLTNEEIVRRGIDLSTDEMCFALKLYLGHVDYLLDKCDYILIPRIDNFKLENQTCTNFLSAYDIVSNICKCKLLNYNIDLEKRKTLKKGLLKIGKTLGKNRKEVLKAYRWAYKKSFEKRKMEINNNVRKLSSRNIKILIMSHPYNIYDNFIGMQIAKYLEKKNIELIYSDRFESKMMDKLSKKLSKDLYFKYSKDNLGALVYCFNKIDGIIFLSAFPCATDSLTNELVMRKIDIPYLNLVIDTTTTFTGFETRLESFIDVLKGGLND